MVNPVFANHQVLSVGDEGACFAALGGDVEFENNMRHIDRVVESEARRMGGVFSGAMREEFYDEEAEVERWYQSQHAGLHSGNTDALSDEDEAPQPSGSASASASAAPEAIEDNRLVPSLLFSGSAGPSDVSGPAEIIDKAFEHHIPADEDLDANYLHLDARKFQSFFRNWERDPRAKGLKEDAFEMICNPGILDLGSIMWDSELDGDVEWIPYSHYLDSLHFVSDSANPLGVAVTEDRTIADHLTLRPFEHHRPIKDKYVVLPFEIEGRNFYFGEFRGYHIYILFWPTDDCTAKFPASPSGATAELQVIRFLNFTARWLQENATGMDCPDPYDDSKASWRTYL